MRRVVDWEEVRDLRLLADDLRTAFKDVDALVTHVLRAPRQRELGPALHRENYAEARRKIAKVLAYLDNPRGSA